MRRVLLLLVLLPGMASAQSFIRYYPPASSGSGSLNEILAGEGMAAECVGDSCTISLELNTSTSAPASGDCDASTEEGDVWVQTGDPATINGQTFLCRKTGAASYAWHPISHNIGTTAPATCTVGAIFFDSDATAGSNWMGCTASNTWTTLGGGLGDPGANGIVTRTAANTTVNRSLTAPSGTLVVGNANGVSGNPTLDVDTAIFPVYSSGTGDVPTTGAVGSFYAETDANSFYTYPSTNTEHWLLSIAAGQTTGRLFVTTGTDVLGEITPTDETVLVSNGTTWEKKTLPDCDDTGGQHLNYNTGDNTFSCGTSGDGTGSSFDPGTTLEIYNEFLGGNTTSGTLGNSSAYGAAQAGGTVSYVAGTTNNPGISRLSSHATNDNSGYIVGINPAGSPDTSTAFDNEDWTLDGVFQLGSNSTAITNIGFWFGLWDRIDTLSPTYCINIRYDTDLSDATFIFQVGDAFGAAGCQSAADNTDTAVVASTVTPSAGTFYRFRIRRDTTGVGGNDTIYMRVNDETEKTFCSSGCDDVLADAPSGQALNFGVVYVTRTTSGVLSGDLDYLYMRIPGLVRY